MSSRPITEDDLNAFVDQRLDAARRAEIEAYLDAHPDIAQRISGYTDQRDVLRKLLLPIGEEPVPVELNVARLADHPAGSSRRTWWAAAAAVVLMCFSGAAGWEVRGLSDLPAQGISSLAQEAADNYVVYTPDDEHPVELRARAALVDWVDRRVGRRIEAPNLEASGYRFMGGRVVATAHGPAALFMYDNDRGVRLVMLTRPMTAEREAPMQPMRRNEVSGFSWAANGMGYSLVGPAASQALLHPIADEVRRQIAGDV
ncbi:MAG: anti-sigma factor [Rhodospirillales bacterium]|nr:anti-sigma factor [Rhodospirillales bacterium]